MFARICNFQTRRYTLYVVEKTSKVKGIVGRGRAWLSSCVAWGMPKKSRPEIFEKHLPKSRFGRAPPPHVPRGPYLKKLDFVQIDCTLTTLYGMDRR